MEVQDGCVVASNPQLARTAGRGGTSLVGSKVDHLLCDLGEGLPRPHAPDSLECVLQTSDGRSRTVVCRRVWAEADAEGWLVEDVTDRRDVEGELLRYDRWHDGESAVSFAGAVYREVGS